MCSIDIRGKRDNEKKEMVVIGGIQTPAADFSKKIIRLPGTGLRGINLLMSDRTRRNGRIVHAMVQPRLAFFPSEPMGNVG